MENKKILLSLVFVLIISLILQAYSSMLTATMMVTGTIELLVGEDTEPPVITSFTLDSQAIILNNTISIDLEATDNIGILSISANITLPDNTTLNISLPKEYQPPMLGDYNITFLVEDIFHNKATLSKIFHVRPPIQWRTGVYGPEGKSINATLRIYFSGTTSLINSTVIMKNATLTIPDDIFDIFYILLPDSKLEVKFKSVNISAENNKTAGLDIMPIPLSGYVASYGINHSDHPGGIDLKISYYGFSYGNENALSVWRCADWDFDNEVCNGVFIEINATQNKTNRSFTLELTDLSGFSIQEKITAAPVEKPKPAVETSEKPVEKPKPPVEEIRKKEVVLPLEEKLPISKLLLIVSLETQLRVMYGLIIMLSGTTLYLLMMVFRKEAKGQRPAFR